MGHSHNHGHHHHEVNNGNLSVSIFLNIGITIAQIIGGFISGSLSLLSDALHNFSDVIALLLSYIANKISKKKANEKNTFGYKRVEIIAAFINSTALVIVALFLIYESIKRFYNPLTISSDLVIWLSILGIAFNGFSAVLLKKDAAHNLNMKSAYLHLFSDMIASIAVFVGGILMKYFQWYWVDSLITFGIAIYLIYMGIDILKSSSKILMLFTPDNIDIKEIIKSIEQVIGIHKLHHIHLWHLNDNDIHLEAHIDCKENISISQFNLLVNKIEEVLHHQYNINHSTIQPEFGKQCEKEYIVNH